MLTIITLSVLALPPIPGAPGLPPLPPIPGAGKVRPGPPNKGVVRWLNKPDLVIAKEDVGIKENLVHMPTYQTYHGVPEWLHWSSAFLLSNAQAEDTLRFSCPPDNGDNLPCTFYVVVYKCHPCSAQVNGGLPAALEGAGFATGGCGPKYESLFIDHLHKNAIMPTAIYRKEIASDDYVDVQLDRALLHAAVFELSIGQQCSLKPVIGCNGGCVVKDGSCVDGVICPKRPSQGPQQGPTKPATTCQCRNNPFGPGLPR